MERPHPIISLPPGLTAIGIDGCKGRWLLVSLTHDGLDVHLYDQIEEICEHYAAADAMLIDMPVGLPESPLEIRPESALRKKLKGRASTVFNVPCRQAVQETEYAAASSVNYEVLGKRLSRQSFGILPQIREIDNFLQMEPSWKNRLMESHPEYCFALLNNGRPIVSNKRTPEGEAARIKLLMRYFPTTQALIIRFHDKYPGSRSKTDDLLDALVLAVIGAAGLRNGFHTLPDTVNEDSRGIRMQIVGTDLV